MTGERKPFMVEVEVDCLFGPYHHILQAKSRITRTGCNHFLLQACRLIIYYKIKIIVKNK